jgi:hypothetical protein
MNLKQLDDLWNVPKHLPWWVTALVIVLFILWLTTTSFFQAIGHKVADTVWPDVQKQHFQGHSDVVDRLRFKVQTKGDPRKTYFQKSPTALVRDIQKLTVSEREVIIEGTYAGKWSRFGATIARAEPGMLGFYDGEITVWVFLDGEQDVDPFVGQEITVEGIFQYIFGAQIGFNKGKIVSS